MEAVRFESSADRRDDPGAGPEETIPEDEYAVYEAVLTQKFGLGPGSFVVMNEILVAREVAWIREEMKRPRVADQGDLFCTLSESCLADFLKKGEWPFKLGRCFQPTFAYHLMTEAESKEIWEPPPGQLEFHDGWAAFHQRHAGAAWVSLSRAGFDEHHAQALMEAGLLVDGEAGEGGLILLARLDGEWKITGELVSWIA